MSANDLRYERIALFKDTIQGNDPKRMPYFGNLWSWKTIDAGYKLSDALMDYDVMEKVIRHFAENYAVDSLYEYGWRNPIQATTVLGNTEYIIDEEAKAISIADQCFMEEDDYDALITDPKKFLWEVYIPRKYKRLEKGNNSVLFRAFLGEYGKFGAAVGKFSGILQNEYGLAEHSPVFSPYDYFGHGIELLFNNLRGIKGLAYDMRRRPEQVLAAIDALNETFVYPRIERAKASIAKGSDPEFCVDMNPVLFAHSIFNTKQFETFYWPYLKELAEYAEENDKLVYIFAEGLSDRFYDFFRELPENRFAIHFEQDDVFKAKKELPNITIAGGMPYSLLGSGTPTECVDYAKKLIDELAYDKKYIFSEDKMISYETDCRSENLKAVTEYISTYRY